jgi:hypothetical protein
MNYSIKRESLLVAAGIAVASFWAIPSQAQTQALTGTQAAPAPRAGTQALIGTQALTGTQAAAAPRPGTQALTGTQAARPGQPMALGTQALTAAPGTQAARPGTQALTGTQALGAAPGTQAVRPGTQALTGTQALAAPRPGTQALTGTQTAAPGTAAVVRPGTQALGGTQAARGSVAATRPGTQAATAGSQAFSGPPSVVPAIQGPIHPVSTKAPGTLVMLLDSSASMLETFVPGTQKAQAASNAINGTLADFVRASNQGGTIKDRWNVGVYQYGGKGVSNALKGALAGPNAIVPISQIAQHPAEVVQVADAEGLMVPSPLWVHANAEGGTPMKQAFRHVTDAITGHEKNLVLAVHVTDGQSTDGDPTQAVNALSQKVASQGGQLLVTNIHISENADPAKALVFPTPAEAASLDAHGQLLYSLSSPVPASLAEQLGTRPGARMFAYNAAPDQLARVFRAGSSVAGGTVAP